MKALNFYSHFHYSQLEKRRKSCSIRLGDKRQKYEDGDIVWITTGNRFGEKQQLYTAMIDKVHYKQIADLSLQDLISENPDAPTVDQLISFLSQIYKKTINPTDHVSVIYFSEIIERK